MCSSFVQNLRLQVLCFCIACVFFRPRNPFVQKSERSNHPNDKTPGGSCYFKCQLWSGFYKKKDCVFTRIKFDTVGGAVD